MKATTWKISDQILKNYKLNEFPKRLNRHFELLNSKSLLLRSNIIDLINKIGKETFSSPLVIDGPKGCGKTCSLLQTSQHFMNEKWIVLYESFASQYTIGYEPFDKTSDSSGMYHHTKLAGKLIERVLSTNKESLPENLSNLLKKGLVKDSDLVWNEFLSEVLVQTKVPVLLSIDQVNFLYSQTDYHDTESNVLTADRFVIIKRLLDILRSKQHDNIKMVIAQDKSDFLHSAPLFSSLVSKTAHALKSLDPAGVVLNSQLDPTAKDPFDTQLLPNQVQVFDIQPLSKNEIESWVEFYRQNSVLRSDHENEMIYNRLWMMSNGNPLNVFDQSLYLA